MTVKTNDLTVDNAGAPLRGADVVLVAKSNLTLAPGAVVQQSGTASATPAETLLFGDATTRDSGHGALVRVSNGSAAPIVRSGVGTATAPSLTVGAGARIIGPSVVLDSTQATSLAASITLTAQSLALDSGRISLQLANGGSLPTDAGLVLSGPLLQSLQASQVLVLAQSRWAEIHFAGLCLSIVGMIGFGEALACGDFL